MLDHGVGSGARRDARARARIPSRRHASAASRSNPQSSSAATSSPDGRLRASDVSRSAARAASTACCNRASGRTTRIPRRRCASHPAAATAASGSKERSTASTGTVRPGRPTASAQRRRVRCATGWSSATSSRMPRPPTPLNVLSWARPAADHVERVTAHPGGPAHRGSRAAQRGPPVDGHPRAARADRPHAARRRGAEHERGDEGRAGGVLDLHRDEAGRAADAVGAVNGVTSRHAQ